MITIIDKDGNVKQKQNDELEAQISYEFMDRKVSDVKIDKELGCIWATVEGLGKNINCGFIEDYGLSS